MCGNSMRRLMVCQSTAMPIPKPPITVGMTSMRKRRPSLPFVERWRDRHGKMRFYFRRRGSPRIALIGEFGSEEFHAAYALALHGGAAEDTRPKIGRPGNGTLGALILSYKQDAGFRDL